MSSDPVAHVARALRTGPSRRDILRGLASLPVVASLSWLTLESGLSASGRKKRNKQKQRKRAKADRRRKRGQAGSSPSPGSCSSQARSATCQGACGLVKNNCEEMVDCGACDCTPACGPGERCGDDGSCESAAGIAGDPCETHADCLGDLICDCGMAPVGDVGKLGCTQDGVCRVNHAPVAFPTNMIHPWRYEVIGIELRGFEPDFDWPLFRIVSQPTYGWLSLPDAPIQVFTGDPGTPALPPPPLPEDSGGVRCRPRCAVTDTCQPGDPPCQDCSGPIIETMTCPEGQYWMQIVNYVPFSAIFTGTDSFTYAMLDAYGAESPPAIALLTVYEL